MKALFFKYKKYLFLSDRQFRRFFIIGLSSLFLDVFSLVLFKEVLFFNPVLAVAINQSLVIGFNFNLNKYWSFGARRSFGKHFFRYLVVVGINYFSSLFLMFIFNQVLEFNYVVVRLGSIALLFIMNFILYRHWVYKEK